MADPVSIRTNNPGAQWYGPTAQGYGATGRIDLPGGNNAAVFDDPVNGAAAQFALWGKHYTDMPLSAAISKWSGGNSSPAYVSFIQKQTGLSPDTVLTRDVLAGPQGVALAKAQAHWEAGRDYPLSDDQWRAAQAKAFGAGDGAPQVPAETASGAGAPSTAPPAAAAPAASAAAPGGMAPDRASGLGMLSGADLSQQGANEPDLGSLMQRAAAMSGAQQQAPPPLPPIQFAVPAALRARLAAVALGQG